MKQTLHVIRREYTEHVRKRSFIISTILVPVLMLAFLVLPIIFAVVAPDEAYTVTLLDATGEIGREFVRALDDTLKSGETRFLVNAISADGGHYEDTRRRLVSEVYDGRLDILLTVPPTVFEDGKVAYITRDVRNFTIQERMESILTDIVLQRRLEREGLDYQQVRALTRSVRMEMNQITSTGEMEERDFLSEWGVVFIFIMILYMALLTWGITISRGIIEEKGSRIVEVLLSSLRPMELMFGKVIGIGLAGLTQLAIWATIGFTITVYGATAASPILASIHVPPAVFLYFILYFILGFLLYSSIFTVIGSICSTEQDAQQLQGLVTLPMVIPILCLMLIIQSPNSAFAVVLSLIPVFTPMVMLARIILLEPPLWQILLSVALLVLSIYAAVSFSSRVFRIGILMYGKRPNLREVIRWYRLAG